MFSDPSPSPYDLHLRLFGIPVRVHPSFWLFSAIFGWGYLNRGFGYLLLWIGCVFVSILVHELGHVLMGQLFGRPGHIVLYSFGGLAIGDFQVSRCWQRILISLGGPGAGLLLGGLVWLLWNYLPAFTEPEARLRLQDQSPAVEVAIDMLLFINFLWSLVNLVPVWPLDGGHVSREICQGISPRRGLWLSLGVSFLLAASVALYSIIARYRPELPYPESFDPVFNAILFGILAVQSYQLLQTVERQRRFGDDDWERDPDIWGR